MIDELGDGDRRTGLVWLSHDRLDSKVSWIERVIQGDEEGLGLSARVSIIWRSWVAVLCVLSAMLSSIVTYLLSRL